MTKPTPRDTDKVPRAAHLRWVPIADTKVPPQAQRELNMARVSKLAAEFDLEQIGTPTVSLRDGNFWVLDGQHRIEALREMGWGDQQIQCWTYENLTEGQEAEVFLKLNDTLPVPVFQRFRIAVNAGREVECDIDRIVRAQGLHVSLDNANGAVGAVGTLKRIYSRAGARTLGLTLRVVRDSYGDIGLNSAVLDGIGLLCGRYPDLDEKVIVARLYKTPRGADGLLEAAHRMRKAVNQPRAQCVAAAAVDIINAGRGKNILPNWWRETTP